MKSSHAALAVLGLAFAGLWYTGEASPGSPQPTAAAAQPRVSAPIAHANLTVYFIHGPDEVSGVKVASLQEALEAGWAVVHETGDVNTLAIENRSPDCELFVQEGDIVQGGRQDRLIAMDMLVPPNSGRVPFPANCVEHGRWSGRGGEAATHFNKSNNFAVSNELRLANANGDQTAVWANVKFQQDKLSENLGTKVNASVSESSLQLALENPVVQAKMGEFEQALRPAGESHEDVVGVVFVVNGKVRAFDMYGSNALFRKAWPKLLRSAAADAEGKKNEKPAPAPNAREVERFVALAGQQPESPAAVVGRAGGPVGDLTNEDIGLANLDVALPDLDRVQGQVEQNRAAFAGRSGVTRTQLLRAGQPAPNPPPMPNADVNPAGRGWVDVGNLVNDNRGGNSNRAAAQAAANPDGNRLTVNRVEDRSGLVSESRDAGRQNAVIHRSYIKK